jgi:altronate dehydratase
MDSPSNDLESVAGQVASGANMIFFTTGNGSITNFHFVPTVKTVSTTGRYNPLAEDVDVSAGGYLDALLAGDPSLWADQILRTVAAVASRMYTPSSFAQGKIDLQFTRGCWASRCRELLYRG